MKSLILLFFVVIYGVMGLPNYRENRVLSPSSFTSSMRSKQSVISVSVSDKENDEKEETGGGRGGEEKDKNESKEEAENLLRGNINSDETIKYKNIPISTNIKPTTIATTNFATLTETKKVTNSKNSEDPNGIKETRESLGKIRPQLKITTNYTSASETGVKLPEGASAALAKPTKYHYYPHNQHIYLLPECAVQQVCNAVYVRLNFTQPLCACPGRYRDPCSASLDSDDHHTTELVTDPRTKALTLVKTCEPVADMRECRAPKDWSLLALQNVRTGKSHYLVICRCPDTNILEGPMSHDQPMYASVPGIRVYGMMCVQGNRRGRPLRYTRSLHDHEEREEEEEEEENSKPSFPWHKVPELMKLATL